MSSDVVCRLCAETNELMLNVLELQNSEEIRANIFLVTKIQIQKDDHLSRFICQKCRNKVKEFFDFCELCAKNQEHLESVYLLQQQQIREHKYIDTEPETEYGIKNDSVSSEDWDEVKNKTVSSSQPEEGKTKYQSLLRSCEKCGKLVDKSRMKSHINQHLGIQPYSCGAENCGKSFYCPYSLTAHKRNQHSSWIHVCSICGRTYKVQKSLYNHMQKHKEPKYDCKVCGKKYKTSTYLKRHMRCHTGERPYKCDMCPQAFANPYNLKCHVRSHTKEKPFACKICSASYGYNVLLKAHVLKVHNLPQ